MVKLAASSPPASFSPSSHPLCPTVTKSPRIDPSICSELCLQPSQILWILDLKKNPTTCQYGFLFNYSLTASGSDARKYPNCCVLMHVQHVFDTLLSNIVSSAFSAFKIICFSPAGGIWLLNEHILTVSLLFWGLFFVLRWCTNCGLSYFLTLYPLLNHCITNLSRLKTKYRDSMASRGVLWFPPLAEYVIYFSTVTRILKNLIISNWVAF